MKKNKFRVWDKVDAEFADYDEIYIDQEGEIYFIEERSWAYQTYMHKENISETVVIVQFTGLHDKNGKEIYEGDIVSFEDAYYSTSENGQEFEVFQNKGAIEYCSEELRYYVTNKQSIDDEQIFSNEIEVIGNIYENPELLGAAE